MAAAGPELEKAPDAAGATVNDTAHQPERPWQAPAVPAAAPAAAMPGSNHPGGTSAKQLLQRQTRALRRAKKPPWLWLQPLQPTLTARLIYVLRSVIAVAGAAAFLLSPGSGAVLRGGVLLPVAAILTIETTLGAALATTFRLGVGGCMGFVSAVAIEGILPTSVVSAVAGISVTTAVISYLDVHLLTKRLAIATSVVGLMQWYVDPSRFGALFALQVWASIALGSMFGLVATALPLPLPPTARRETLMRLRLMAAAVHVQLGEVTLAFLHRAPSAGFSGVGEGTPRGIALQVSELLHSAQIALTPSSAATPRQRHHQGPEVDAPRLWVCAGVEDLANDQEQDESLLSEHKASPEVMQRSHEHNVLVASVPAKPRAPILTAAVADFHAGAARVADEASRALAEWDWEPAPLLTWVAGCAPPVQLQAARIWVLQLQRILRIVSLANRVASEIATSPAHEVFAAALEDELCSVAAATGSFARACVRHCTPLPFEAAFLVGSVEAAALPPDRSDAAGDVAASHAQLQDALARLYKAFHLARMRIAAQGEQTPRDVLHLHTFIFLLLRATHEVLRAAADAGCIATAHPPAAQQHRGDGSVLAARGPTWNSLAKQAAAYLGLTPSYRKALLCIKGALAVLAAAVAALALDDVIGLPQFAYWSPLAVALLIGASDGGTLRTAALRFLATAVGGSYALFVVVVAVGNRIVLAAFLCAWEALLAFVRTSPRYRYFATMASFTVAVILLGSNGQPTTGRDVAIARIDYTLLAVLVFAVITLLLFPVSARTLARERLAASLQDVSSSLVAVDCFASHVEAEAGALRATATASRGFSDGGGVPPQQDVMNAAAALPRTAAPRAAEVDAVLQRAEGSLAALPTLLDEAQAEPYVWLPAFRPMRPRLVELADAVRRVSLNLRALARATEALQADSAAVQPRAGMTGDRDRDAVRVRQAQVGVSSPLPLGASTREPAPESMPPTVQHGLGAATFQPLLPLVAAVKSSMTDVLALVIEIARGAPALAPQPAPALSGPLPADEAEIDRAGGAERVSAALNALLACVTRVAKSALPLRPLRPRSASSPAPGRAESGQAGRHDDERASSGVPDPAAALPHAVEAMVTALAALLEGHAQFHAAHVRAYRRLRRHGQQGSPDARQAPRASGRPLLLTDITILSLNAAVFAIKDSAEALVDAARSARRLWHAETRAYAGAVLVVQ